MKANLTIESANPVVKVALEAEGQFVIGRSNAADLPLNDPAISRQHCALTVTSNAVQVEDLVSASGTFVNGQRVLGAMRLNSGDRIKVGNTVLRFSAGTERRQPGHAIRAEPASAPVLEDPELTMVRRPGTSQYAATRQAKPAASLTASTPIDLKKRLVIGRDPLCDLPLASREISRHHAEIREEHGVHTVRDLSSTNGTFLNGVEVRGRMPLTGNATRQIGLLPVPFSAKSRPATGP